MWWCSGSGLPGSDRRWWPGTGRSPAADLGALAGAALVLQGGPAACDRAADLVAADGGRLAGCRVDGLDLIVTAQVEVAGLGTARASARAGPVSSAGGGTIRASASRGVTIRASAARGSRSAPPPPPPGVTIRASAGAGQVSGRLDAGPPAAATDSSTTSSTRIAPCLDSGRCRCRTSGTGRRTGSRSRRRTSAIASRVAPQPRARRPVRPLGEAGAAGMAVVDEDGRARSVSGCSGGGQAADVPAVAGGDQRQQADRGVLGGVQRAGHVGRVDPGRAPAPAARRCTRRRPCAARGRAGRAARCRSPRRWRSGAAGTTTTWLVTSTSPRNSPTGPAST